MAEGYIVTVEIFIPMKEVKLSREGTENTKKEIARILVEEMAEESGYGHEVYHVMKV